MGRLGLAGNKREESKSMTQAAVALLMRSVFFRRDEQTGIEVVLDVPTVYKTWSDGADRCC